MAKPTYEIIQYNIPNEWRKGTIEYWKRTHAHISLSYDNAIDGLISGKYISKWKAAKSVSDNEADYKAIHRALNQYFQP